MVWCLHRLAGYWKKLVRLNTMERFATKVHQIEPFSAEHRTRYCSGDNTRTATRQQKLMPDTPRRRRRSNTLPADAPDVASPCISVCEMDKESGLCTGCYRTLEEIATWSRIPNQQRWDIVRSLRERRTNNNFHDSEER